MQQLFSVFLFSFASLFFTQCEIGKISSELLSSRKWTTESSETKEMTILRKEKPENEVKINEEFTLLGKEKPENVVDEGDSIELLSSKKWTTEPSETKEMTILKTEKPENEVEERDSITILAIEKEPLQSEYIDELFIEKVIKPENKIQIIDQMGILKDEKPENEVKKEKYKHCAIKKYDYSRDISQLKTPVRSGKDSLQDSYNRKNLTAGSINKSSMFFGFKKPNFNEHNKTVQDKRRNSFLLKLFKRSILNDDLNNKQDVFSYVGRNLDSTCCDTTKSLEEELVSKGVKRNLNKDAYIKIDIPQIKKTQNERYPAPLRGGEYQKGNNQKKVYKGALLGGNYEIYKESKIIDNKSKKVDISSFSDTWSSKRIVCNQNEFITGMGAAKGLTKAQENELLEKSNLYPGGNLQIGKTNGKCNTDIDKIPAESEGQGSNTYKKSGNKNVLIEYNNENTGRLLKKGNRTKSNKIAGGKFTAIKPGKNIKETDKKFNNNMVTTIKGIYGDGCETEVHFNNNSFGFNIVDNRALENGFVKPELKSSNTYKKKV